MQHGSGEGVQRIDNKLILQDAQEGDEDNRAASGGINVLGGVLNSRATAQFGVFHPANGPYAFPKLLSFTPEKFLAVSSYQPSTKLFPGGKAIFSGSGETRDQPRPKALKTDHGRVAEVSLVSFQFQDMEVQR